MEAINELLAIMQLIGTVCVSLVAVVIGITVFTVWAAYEIVRSMRDE